MELTKQQITKAFIAACMGMAFFGITMMAVGSVLPSLTEKLTLTATDQSWLASTLTLGIFIGSIVFGPVCDHYGHRGIFLISCFGVLAGLFGLSAANSFAAIVPCYILIGIGGGVLNGQTNTLASDLYDDLHRGSMMSLLGAFYGVGAILITCLVALTKDMVKFETMLQIIGGLVLLCTLFCCSVKFPEPKQAQSFPVKDAVRMLAQPVLLIMSLVLMLESTVESITNNLATTFFTNNGIANAVMLLTIMSVALMLARFLMSAIGNKISQQVMLYGFLAILLIGFILMAVAGKSFVIAAVAMSLVGIGTAATYPVVLGMLGGKYKNLSGTAFGIAIAIALAGSTIFNKVVGNSLLDYLPQAMMVAVMCLVLLFTLGCKKLNDNK